MTLLQQQNLQKNIAGNKFSQNLHTSSPTPTKKAVATRYSRLDKEFLCSLYLAQPQNCNFQDIDLIFHEHIELEGVWLQWAQEMSSCLKKGKPPQAQSHDSWLCFHDPNIKLFFDKYLNHATTTQKSVSHMNPFTKLKLEYKKINLRRSLQLMKEKSIQIKLQNPDEINNWQLMSHTLIQTTKELERIESVLRNRT